MYLGRVYLTYKFGIGHIEDPPSIGKSHGIYLNVVNNPSKEMIPIMLSSYVKGGNFW